MAWCGGGLKEVHSHTETKESTINTKGSDLGIKWQEAHSNPTLFDFDDDGDLDLYLTNTYGRRGDLYRNRLIKTGELRFGDATERLRAATYDVADKIRSVELIDAAWR